MSTVNTGAHTQLFFSTSGTSTQKGVNILTASLNAHLAAGATFDNVDSGSGALQRLGSLSPLPGTVVYTMGVAGDSISISGGQFVIDSVGGPSTVQGSSSGGDSILSVGATGGTGLDYTAMGGSNLVVFNDGSNVYNATAGDTGLDSIYAGAGFDTINTGLGATSVFSGTGDAVIFLNDSATSTFHRDVAVIHDGRNTVNATGAVDVVFSSALGQVFNSGAGTDYYVLQPDSQLGVNGVLSGGESNGIVSSSGLNLINGGAGTSIIFDQNQGNTVNAGAGTVYFVGESSLNATDITEANTINAAQGTVIAFSASGDSLTAAVSGSAAAYFVAGDGNETLNASTSTGTVVFYGSQDLSTVNSSVTGPSETVIGGAGTNFFVTGLGSESLVAGSGTNAFYIEAGSASTTITINDFNPNGNDWAVFESASVASVTTVAIGGQQSLSYTLTDGTTVNFVGITSINGHVS